MVNWASVPYCFLENKEIAKFRLAAGDLVIARTGGTIGKSFLITEKLDEIAVFASYLIRVIPDKLKVNPGYLLRFLDSPCYWKQLSENSRGTGQPNVNARALSEIKVPLPPIEEQNRIVEQVNKLFDLIDCAEKAYNELSGPLSERFRQLCLEKAIQGKLVPQLESEPKVELQNEKESFEIPFEIPSKWKWTTLEQICLQITDGEHKTPKYQIGGVPFLSVKDISSKKLNFSNTKFVSLEDFNVIKKRCYPQKGDILLSKVGSTGIPAIVDTDKEFALFVSVALLKLNKLLVLDKFLWYLLQSPLVQKQAKENTRGIGNKNWVLKAIKATMVPLPPILEQHRIVDQLEKIFSSINSLSK